MARLPNFLVIIRSEKLSGKGQGRGVGVRKKERFVLGKRTFRSQKSKHFVLRIILALEKTGASEYISNSLVSELGTYGPLALMAGIYFTTSLMTMFISNTATAVLLAPIAMQSATQIGVSPVPFLFAVTLGASMCFASPFSTPPNALVMPAGQYTFMDYVKVGLPLQIIMGIVMVLVLPLLFPF